MLEIFVDADACPVKEEVNRVARRYQLSVTYVANSQMRLPSAYASSTPGEDLENLLPGVPKPVAKLIVVGGNPNAADDWIAEHVAANDIVVTGDIPLAYRCVQKGAKVLGNSGDVFDEQNIGHLLATRDLMAELRNDGTISGGGPPPFQKQDRSRFLHALDQIIQRIKQRTNRAGSGPL